MKFVRFLQIAALILIAAGAQPAYSAFYQWSKTPASNSIIDSTINWAEGMSPSGVNDSARAMMARTAEYRDDISGSLSTAGTSTAYTVTTNQGLPSTPTEGQLISVTVNVTNGVNPTLSADGGTAFFIVTSPGVFVPTGTLIAGSPYTLKFSGVNGWMLRDFYAPPTLVPIGSLVPSTLTLSPSSNFILPAGQCISTTTYAVYWALLGSPGPGACGAGLFNVIDMRGRVPAGLDNLNGTAANRMTSNANGCATTFNAVGNVCPNGVESNTLTIARLPAHTHNGTTSGMSVDHTHAGVLVSSTGTTTGGGAFPAVGTVTSGSTAGSSATHTHVFTTDAGVGGGQNYPSLPPIIAVTYLLRVL